jgi:hypothetical protein
MNRRWGFFMVGRHGQRLAAKNYRLWRHDPYHPSLRFLKLQGSENRFTVRIGDHYRALGKLTAGTMTWVWIGTHADYDRWWVLTWWVLTWWVSNLVVPKSRPCVAASSAVMRS